MNSTFMNKTNEPQQGFFYADAVKLFNGKGPSKHLEI